VQHRAGRNHDPFILSIGLRNKCLRRRAHARHAENARDNLRDSHFHFSLSSIQFAAAIPIPPTGVVTAIFSNPATSVLLCGMAFFTAGNDREASWLAWLSHTSVTQIMFSSAASLAIT